MLRALVIILCTATVLTVPTAGAGTAAAPPRVTFIGDSIAAAIQYDEVPSRILARGIDLDVQLAVCRRLVGESCPYKGTQPLTLVDLLPTIRVAPTVIVGVGHNDFQATFPQSVEAALSALRRAGVERVLWLTLREQRPSYAEMNDVVRSAAKRHPELTVVEWNVYSRSHPEWFQDDGLHLNYDGAVAMATLVQQTLRSLGVVQAPSPPRLVIVTKALPPARLGRPYRARLLAAGGTGAVTWTRQAGALPAGLRVLRSGWLAGTPRAVGSWRPTLRAADARGRTATRQLAIVVRTG